MEAPALLLLGFGTGAYGVIVGAGGGFIIVPALILLFNMGPTAAAGTSVAVVALNSLSGSAAYSRMGLVDYRSGLLFAAAAIPGAVTAPFVHRSVSDDTFKILLGVLLLALAVHMLRRAHPAEIGRYGSRASGSESPFSATRRVVTRQGVEYKYRFNEVLATSFNVVLGFISSFFGIGGGFIRTPVLVHAFGFPVLPAVATSIFALTFYTAAGAIVYAVQGHVDWYPTFLWIGVGLIGGAQVGARLVGRIGALWVLRLLLALVLVMGAWLLFQGIVGSRG